MHQPAWWNGRHTGLKSPQSIGLCEFDSRPRHMTNKSRKRTIALIIWWCEGTKARRDERVRKSLNKAVEVTNTDPKIIKIFADYLRDDLKVPPKKIKGQLQIHKGDNKKEIEKYWLNIAKIPKEQLNKTIVRQIGNKPGKNLGTFKIRVYGSEIFDRLSSLLENELKYV